MSLIRCFLHFIDFSFLKKIAKNYFLITPTTANLLPETKQKKLKILAIFLLEILYTITKIHIIKLTHIHCSAKKLNWLL